MVHSIYEAIRDNDIEKVQCLLKNGVSITEVGPKGSTPLDAARAQKRYDILELMLSSYDLSQVCPYHNPHSVRDAYPLFIASELLCTAFIQRWTDYGLPVNICDSSGDTPLHHAARTSRKLWLSINVSCLLDNGADPRIKNKSGTTPLHIVASTYEVPQNMSYRVRVVLSKFLKAKANINAQDSLGRTPLHVAKMRRRFNCVVDLLHFGADINIEDNRGLTILDYIYDKLDSNDCIKMIGMREPLKIEKKLYESTRILIYHAIKMNVLNLYLSDKVNGRVRDLKDWLDFMQAGEVFSEKYMGDHLSVDNIDVFTLKCQEEKKKLEITKIDHRISLYELLHMKNNELLNVKKKNVFMEYIRMEKHRNEFPLFWYFLSLTAKIE